MIDNGQGRDPETTERDGVTLAIGSVIVALLAAGIVAVVVMMLGGGS